MSKSNGSLGFFAQRGRNNVRVIQATVQRNYARKALVGFWVTAITVGLVTAAIAASNMHPVLALLLGAAIGSGCGAVVWAAIRIWPVVRFLWWWATEITLTVGIASGFTMLSRSTDLAWRLVILGLVTGIPLTVPWSRNKIVAWIWCLVVRHRLRVLFTDVIKSNQHGSLPLILWARPTPAGERVHVFLRPGLSKSDLQARLERIAVACWASSALVEQPGSNAAFLRVDIKRRNVLDDTVVSPLAPPLQRKGPSGSRPAPMPATLVDLKDHPLGIFTPDSRLAGKKPANTPPNSNGRKASDPRQDDWV